MSTRLDSLGIEEVSGVDHPATGIEGWLVMKSADGQVDAVRTAEAQLGSVYATLAAATVLDGAPESIVKARDELRSFVEKELTPEAQEPTLIEKLRSHFRAAPAAPVAKAEPAEPAAPAAVEPTAPVAKVEPAEPAEPVLKAEDVDAFRNAIVALSDRMEGIEKHLAGSTQVEGQDAALVSKSALSPLQQGIVAAARGSRVTIS